MAWLPPDATTAAAGSNASQSLGTFARSRPAFAAAGLARVQLALTPLSEAGEVIAIALPGELAGTPVEIVLDRERVAGRGYYRDLCYKVNLRAGRQAGGGELVEIGDGGFTDWAARLAASNKERLLISGVGIDRLAASMSPQPGRERAAAG